MGAFGYALLLAASTVIVVMYAVFASGMFPRGARPAAMRGAAGDALLAGGGALALALAVFAAPGAAKALAWPYAVIAGGLGLLLAPLAFQTLPRALLDTPLGAGLLGAATAALLAAWALLGR